jgi:septal ring factor EnvC (AmiA/AmiB activator)
MSDAAIFRQAVEGMTMKDGKTTTKDGKFVSADTDAAEKIKKTPCATECGQYIELKGKINDLSKYVNAVKDQRDDIKQTADKIQELGKQIEDLNKSLSPGGQLNITI